MGRQGPIDIVELVAAERTHGAGQAGVVAAARGTGLDAAAVKAFVELLDDEHDRVGEFRVSFPHHLDREIAGKFEDGVVGGGSHIDLRSWSVRSPVRLAPLTSFCGTSAQPNPTSGRAARLAAQLR